jgi:hypothetical protein
MTAALRIAVCGYIVRGPIGGMAWHHLQYVLGLHRLGHDVIFVEDSDWYDSCYDPSVDAMTADPKYGLDFATRAFDRVGLTGRLAYYDQHSDRWLGPLGPDAAEALRGIDLLIDLSAVNPVRSWWDAIPVRILVDTDPAFTQLRHLQEDAAAEGAAAEGAARYTHFFSFGHNIGRPGCRVPDDGRPWQPTRQPVVLDAWPLTPGPARGAWTTLMQWDSYPERRHEGVVYAMKSASFQPYMDLPRRAPGRRLALAVGNPSTPRATLAGHGWELLDPLPISADPWTFQAFVQESRGEFSVAKAGYVVSRSGWFSERSTGYLASGRPVVVQDTGFSDWLPTGEGLFGFSAVEEAVAALDAVEGDYAAHCVAARRLAETYFDHRVVLEGLLEQCL